MLPSAVSISPAKAIDTIADTPMSTRASEVAAAPPGQPDHWRLTYGRFALLLLRGEFRAMREIAQAYLRQAEVEGRPEHAVAAHRMLKFELGAFSESREEFERCYGDAFEPRICWDFKHLRPTRFK